MQTTRELRRGAGPRHEVLVTQFTKAIPAVPMASFSP